MDILMRPNPIAIVGAHALATLPLSLSMMKTKTDALKMLCCSVIARAVEVYFEPINLEPYAPMAMSFCTTLMLASLSKQNPVKATYIHIGTRAVIWSTSAAFFASSWASANSITAMAIGSSGGAILATWAVCKIAQCIFSSRKPKPA